jgi:hypothetical protein
MIRAGRGRPSTVARSGSARSASASARAAASASRRRRARERRCAQGDVVQEEAVTGPADVDHALPALEGRQGAQGVVPVESEVAGEVVPRAERDADEGGAALDGDGGDRGEGAVAPGDADRPGRCEPGGLARVLAPCEDVRRDATALGGALQLVDARLGVARARIDDEKPAHRWLTL